MEILITKQCESLTGSLGKGFGYHIQRRKNGFFAKRNSNGEIPANGHLRFIFTCAGIAVSKNPFIDDIRVSRKELIDALNEAERTTPVWGLTGFLDKYPENLVASDIMNFRRTFLRSWI